MAYQKLPGIYRKESPAKHGTLEDFQYGRNGHNPDTMSAKHEDWHLKQSGESGPGIDSPNKQKRVNQPIT